MHEEQSGGSSRIAVPKLITHDRVVKRTVGQLINDQDDAWPRVLEWVASAVRPVEVLPVAPSVGEATLFALQVTTRSPMGAIALRSGGVLVTTGGYGFSGRAENESAVGYASGTRSTVGPLLTHRWRRR